MRLMALRVMTSDGTHPGVTRSVVRVIGLGLAIVPLLKEVKRCTRDGITINTFMLEQSDMLTAFVEQMTRINRGRAFFATPERLGEYVLVDYVEREAQGGVVTSDFDGVPAKRRAGRGALPARHADSLSVFATRKGPRD